MAQIVWTEPALNDLDAIADYIALDNPRAARDLIQRVFRHVEQLRAHPDSGSKPPELRGWRYRQLIEPPCRIFYRHDGDEVVILYITRGERLLRTRKVTGRDRRRRRNASRTPRA